MKYSRFERDHEVGGPGRSRQPADGEQPTEQHKSEAHQETKRGRANREHELSAVDRLECEGKGDDARAKYVASDEVGPALEKRKAEFATAEKQYTDNRAKVEPDLATARDTIKDLLKKLRCYNDDSDDRDKDDKRCRPRPAHIDLELLDEAWRRIGVRLHDCHRHHGGPCLDDDCEFEQDVCDVDLKDLLARQGQYEDRVTKAESLFDKLLTEPTDLLQRMTDLKAEVDDVKAALAAVDQDLGVDAPTADPEMTYIKALVAEFHAKDEQIWAGFTYPYAYEDCLRHCLRCSISGRSALRKIVGEIAERQCRQTKREARCTALKASLAAETKAEAEELKESEKRAEGKRQADTSADD